jgi:hypothetical protein
MDVASALGALGMDAVVVLCIVAVTQLVKRYAGASVKPWLVVIPIVLGIVAGVMLTAGAGWVAVVRGGFVYGTVATWLYSFGTKFLGVAFPGDERKTE